MSSQQSSSGYNNAAFCNQYDYDQLARHAPSSLVNSGNITYIASAVDNCCYEGDEDIQLSTVIARQQRRQLVREPPIGASTTFRFTESRVEHPSTRIPTTPKRNRHDCTPVSPGHIQETIISPRTPKKNVQSITPSTTPRKQSGNIPRRSQSFTSPRKQPISTRVHMPLSPGPVPRQKIMQTTPTRIPAYNIKCVTPQQQIVTSPQRNTAIIPPMYSTQHVPITPEALSSKKKELFVATGVSNKKPHIKMDASPGLRASWIHIPTPYQSPPTGTIVTAAIFLLLCGAASAVLCLYMMSKDGRLYYLDFGVLSGFGSALLGYVVLSMFSMLSCAGLVTILTLRPKPGEPLADVAGGAHITLYNKSIFYAYIINPFATICGI
ncbi:hypothetical protein C0J52_13293 [Blattella germanica]|nr:hypothetical protein C0J52_13293 [Blattella germanica]